MGSHVALHEHGRALGVEPGREHQRGQIERARAQILGIVGDGDRVQVDDAEEGVALLLGCGVLAEAPRVVAEVLGAGGLNAGKDLHRPDYL